MIDRSAMVFFALGIEVVGLVLAGFFLGQAIDEKLGWGGLGTLLCVLAGLGGFLLHVIIYFNKFSRDGEEK